MQFLKSFTLALGLLAAATSATLARENRALLIGASTYPNLDPRYWLKGPSNDIDLVAHYLTSESPVPFAANNVTILADGIAGKQAPTLAAIRKAFADLTAQVQPGDFVYLHFSGHGSQAPAHDPATELDGLDELFLPVDIGPWDDSTGQVTNALVDDEIGQMIGGLRAKGALVWAVFDSCHSGTATRGAPSGNDDVLMRKIEPDALGIPIEKMDAAEATSRALPDPRARANSPISPAEDSGFVAFFAAQTNETTPELRLPKGNDDRRSQGVFTFVIFETLAQNPGITYRQLGQEVLRRYSVNNLAQSTPMFEGDLDTVVFSGAKVKPVTQWPVSVRDSGVSIAAGSLHNLNDGTTLALLASPSDAADKTLGYFRVASSEAFSSVAEPVALNGKVAINPADIPAGAVLRKIGEDIDFTLTVALPDASVSDDASGKLAKAIAILKSGEDNSARIRFVAAGAEADIRLALLPDSPRPDAVWMLPSTGFVELSGDHPTPSVGTADKTTDELANVMLDNFTRMARAFNLLKIGGGLGVSDMKVTVGLQTRNKTDRTLRPLDPVSVPQLIPGDEVHIVAANNSDVPVDVNVLYVSSSYAISHFFAGRLQPGDTLKKGLLRITDKGFGRDRVVMVITPAKPQTVVENLAFMAQDDVQSTRGTTQSGMAGLMAQAGFGTTTRSAMALDDDEGGPGGEILQFEIDTKPAQ